jgi:hypothetical protein
MANENPEPIFAAAVDNHLHAATGRLAGIVLNRTQDISSNEVVYAWCGRDPEWIDTLQNLWLQHGSADWAPSPGGPGKLPTYGVGSASLARMLTQQNRGRYPGVIDQNLLLGLTPPGTMQALALAIRW